MPKALRKKSSSIEPERRTQDDDLCLFPSRQRTASPTPVTLGEAENALKRKCEASTFTSAVFKG
jgi:hypothetical protein